MKNVLHKLLHEPLVHFVALAFLILVGFHLTDRPTADKPDRIVISGAKIEQLAALFAKSWQRPPSTDELKGIIDDYIKEEIYYREALSLGLDKDDTVIRRRLRQKVEFLFDVETALQPTDAELEKFLDSHRDQFRVEPMMAFQQIHFKTALRGDAVQNDAKALLDQLRTAPEIDLAQLGDQTLLPAAMPLSNKSAIAQTFGADFVTQVEALPVNSWWGPITSSYGIHLVRVTERKEGRHPNLSDVREAVRREWLNARRESLVQERLRSLLQRYEVHIENIKPAQAGP